MSLYQIQKTSFFIILYRLINLPDRYFCIGIKDKNSKVCVTIESNLKVRRAINWYFHKLKSTWMIIIPQWQIRASKVRRYMDNVIQNKGREEERSKSIVSFKPVRQFCIWNGWLIAHFHNFHLHLYPLIIPGLKFQPRVMRLFCSAGMSTHA